MNLNKLASAILRGTWLMEPRTAMGFFPLAERFLSGEKISWFDQAEKRDINQIRIMSSSGFTKISSTQSAGAQSLFADVPEGSVVVIPVAGTIMAEDDCWGSPGTNTMSSWLMAARDAENIAGAILHINSGGGSVEGTAEFAQVISAVAKDMPVEAYVEGMACSAAYWLASCCSKITASSGTVEFGSIGTAVKFTDYSQMYAKNGVNAIYINASASVDKNQDYYEAIKGNNQPMLDNVLDPTNAIFLDAVKTNRGEKLKLSDRTDKDGKVLGQEPLTGKTYIAQKAIDNGLIDGIGSMAGVLQSVQTAASGSNLLANTPKKNMNIFGSDFPKLNALKGKDASAITAEDIKGVNEEFAAKGMDNLVVISAAHFAQAGTLADANANALTTANAALGEGKGKTTLSEAVTALVADRDAEKLRAETYGAQPGAKPSRPASGAAHEGGLENENQPEAMTETERKADRIRKSRNK